MSISRSLAAMILAVCCVPAFAADVEETQRAARAALLSGRDEDAEKAWHYLSELGVSAGETSANLALTLRDKGDHEAATAQWLKTTLLEETDGFAWNQRGWSYLATGRRREARESFSKAIERSSTTATQAEANVGLGLTAILDGKPRAADEPLRRAGLAGPYAISASAQLTAEAAIKLGDRPTALPYLRQALEVDSANGEALGQLARQLEESGDNRSAWRAYRRLLSLDPKNAAARKAYERVARFVTGDQDSAAGVRRVARPVLNPE
ncbi:MAG: tetratricopeptide repeat protein, partial [Elusimicrobia bacterium]|nr:tetratricopeptide repeat protein [Elusimicrobiota bacterium]